MDNEVLILFSKVILFNYLNKNQNLENWISLPIFPYILINHLELSMLFGIGLDSYLFIWSCI